MVPYRAPKGEDAAPLIGVRLKWPEEQDPGSKDPGPSGKSTVHGQNARATAVSGPIGNIAAATDSRSWLWLTSSSHHGRRTHVRRRKSHGRHRIHVRHKSRRSLAVRSDKPVRRERRRIAIRIPSRHVRDYR